jgi:hypothetical protein
LSYVGRRKTVCIYIDAELVEEAAKAAEERGTSLSWIVEDALRLYVAYVLRRPEPQARRTKRTGRRKPPAETTSRREVLSAGSLHESSLQSYTSAAPQSTSALHQLPPHLQNNAWIAVLRSRR